MHPCPDIDEQSLNHPIAEILLSINGHSIQISSFLPKGMHIDARKISRQV